MTNPPVLFDASSILNLVRELRQDAPDKLLEGSTITLAYYEIGNALWKECFLLKRITNTEAENLLTAIFAIIAEMKATTPSQQDKGKTTLETAVKHKLTFYDAAYLTEAKNTKSTLVTDDKKLADTAKKTQTKTQTSKEFTNKPNTKKTKQKPYSLTSCSNHNYDNA